MQKKILDFEENIPHKVSETICIKCGYRAITVRPLETLLKQLECGKCGKIGYVIETGEGINE